MKLIIAGSRHLNLGTQVMDIALQGIPELRDSIGYNAYEQKLTEVVSGGASGIDQMGEYWSQAALWELPNRNKPKLTVMNAQWQKYGKRAGHIRNGKMAVYADVLLLIWDGKSPGSANMKEQMLKLNKPVYELIFRGSI